VLVQTFTPDHELLRAVQLGDPSRLVDGEMARREMLGLPPFRALGVVEGADAAEFAQASGLEFALTAKGAMVRADSWMELGVALAATPRPPGSRLRVEVDPPRV
jgi:primosomal protein N' (replication factor Y)